MVDEFSRYAIRVSVAQICQIIGWTSIHSSPLEILTDILQEYISGLAKIASNYALLYGQCEPNLNHVALAFQEMGISINELEEYVTYVESTSALEVPKYPIPKESHLNNLKPGSREVVTRPVHIHEHLPPMHPHLEDQEYSINKSPLTVEISTNDSLSPLSSPKSIFKKPGDPVSNDIRRARQILEDEVRPLREISSVMMTTSGFLSPAREGKLPEARTQPLEFNRSSLSPEGPSIVDQSAVDKCEKKKKIKPIDVPKKTEKENKVKEEPCEQKETEEEAKGKKHVNNNKETSKLKALKTGALKVPQKPPSPLATSPSQKKAKVQLSPTPSQVNSNIKQIRVKSPKIDKRSISPLLKEVVPVPTKDTCTDADVKLPSEPDKHKLNIFKKISKVKEESDDSKTVTSDHRENNLSSFDMFFMSQSRKNLNETVIKEEDDIDTQIDVENNSPPIKYEYSPPPEVDKIPDLPKISEPKKKKKDKQKEKRDIEMDKDHYHYSPKNKYQFEENLAKTKLPVTSDITIKEEDSPSPTFPFFPVSVSPAPSLIPSWNNPLIPHNMCVPPLNIPNSSPNVPPMKNQDVPPTAGQPPIFSSSSSSTNNVLPATATFPNKENSLLTEKKKERKRDKKFKEKIKKKKDKKDKNKIKDKSERKKLKLEKKEKSKLKLKKEKKEKKKEKEGLVSRVEPGHIAEDILNTLQPWTSENVLSKKIKLEEKDETTSPVPKITFKLGPASPKEMSEPGHRKIVIKPIVKKEEDNFDMMSSSFVQDLAKPLTSTPKNKSHKGGKTNHQNKNDPFLEKSMVFSMPPVLQPKMDLFPVVPKWEADPNKVWICPACGRPDDGSPMIACDLCDLWFHWTCVGIQEAIDGDWYCNSCNSKRGEGPSEKKKKHRKKKS